MVLSLHNTLSRRQERFVSRKPGEVKIFTCGPSIYSRPHIGNYRTYLFEDILQRYLEYLGYRVERLINFTDIEDKTLAEAARLGQTLPELTEPLARRFRRETALLDIKLPKEIPRSSTTVEAAVELIKLLLAKGYAYRHGRDIFFDPLKYKGFGRLYGLDMRRWPKKKRRFRQDTYPGQRWNLGDFILWHGQRPGAEEIFAVESELGKGRPAWNIQDPAIIRAYLGEQIDISCGGVDNLFRHHDYNLAIMEAASDKKFANYWLHAAHVLVDGRKMSKSRGNIIYPGELLRRHKLSAPYLRFLLLKRHYRQQLRIRENSLTKARQELDGLRGKLVDLLTSERPGPGSRRRMTKIKELPRAFEERMNDDLDVSGAIAAIGQILTELAPAGQGGLADEERRLLKAEIRRLDSVFNFLQPA